jgi:hypothetical protein
VFNPLWYPLVSELLGAHPKHGEGGVCLLYACVMVAEGTGRGSVSATTRTAQQWHGDGGHIFEHAHQPPHCINVFVCENGLFEPFAYKNEHFTKTGSGQT